MHLFLRMLCLNEQIIIVLLLTTLVIHYNVSGVSGMQYDSHQNFGYDNSVDSDLTYESDPFDPGINSVISSITEMEQDNDTISSETGQASDPRDSAVMTMQRHETPGGKTPVYSLTIHGNGSVIYNGIKNVDTSGIQSYQIPKDKARELANEFINIYYFALKDNYSNSSNASNLSMVTTSISMNGRTKTVVDDKSSYAPQPLRALEDKIDQVTNSKRWLEAH